MGIICCPLPPSLSLPASQQAVILHLVSSPQAVSLKIVKKDRNSSWTPLIPHPVCLVYNFTTAASQDGPSTPDINIVHKELLHRSC